MLNSPKLPQEKVLRDPVHNYIRVDYQVILNLIDTPEFQRLRRIKQLGTTSFTFQGAEHSRFTHSLGVYEITRQICEHFQVNYPSKQVDDGLWDDQHRLVALCAALLHDIGHGAYSHTFEHIFNTDHEAITQAIIKEPTSNVYQVLSSVAPDFPEKVASVIDHTYANPQVIQMISSQIDADRMDYLLRDAYNTGTKYGEFDLSRVLQVMRPYQNGIAFTNDGMHAVEDYVISRFQMYQQIYFHPVSRGMEVVLTKLLQRAKFLYTNEKITNNPTDTPQLLVPFFKNESTLTDYLRLDDGVLNTYFLLWQDSPDQILSDLAKRFLNRRPFKSICYTQQTQSQIIKLKTLVEQVGYNPEYYTTENSSFDLPYDAADLTNQKPKSQIMIIQADGSLSELSSLSALVASISGKLTGDDRFYFPKEMLKSQTTDVFAKSYATFQSYLINDQIKTEL